MWNIMVVSIVGTAYGEGVCSDSDSETEDERGMIPERSRDRIARVSRFIERVREKYISRSVGSRVKGESMVTISLGEAKSGRAWRASQAEVAKV